MWKEHLENFFLEFHFFIFIFYINKLKEFHTLPLDGFLDA